ncbi:MAG TPA: M28 family peptidase [Bacteroidales bacterium]|nr:M28 family peptidase [Bacteroidales bacterium]
MLKKNLLTNIIQLSCVMFIFFLISCNSQKEITADELIDHVTYLASDSLKGRLTGSPGDSLAALYIRDDLSSCGFVPATGDGFQRFSVTGNIYAGNNNSLSIHEKSYTLNEDFVPLAFSSDNFLSADVVFAGYGFNIHNDSVEWNDYEDLNVKGKWVMILRSDPDIDKSESRFESCSSDIDKALMAKDMGAAGILLVSGNTFDPQDLLEPLNSEYQSIDIPAIRIKRYIADIILSGSGRKIDELEKQINKTEKPHSFPTGTLISARSEIIREMSGTRNVVMILPGEIDSLKDEFLIIGAHFDHLGMGGTGSSSRTPDTIAVHYGADDNASGIGAMLELAEKFALTPGSHPRSIVCIAFSGEEKGLLGSKYFTENPLIDLGEINAMINLDMLGRLQETNILQVSGAGTAPRMKDIINSINDTSILKLTVSDEGYGPSDHSSFYAKDIPVLFFSTGAHLDYHTPSDTHDKINYEGMVKVSSFIFEIAEFLASDPERLKFTESGPSTDLRRQMRRRGLTLGIMPDFAGNIKNGLRADLVTPGRPADLGGMKKGDIITAINGKRITNIQDYMFRMGQLEKGQTINVDVLRDSTKILLLIQL